MKRKLVIATAAAALLIGAGTTAFATTDSDSDDARPTSVTTTLDKDGKSHDDSADGRTGEARESDDGDDRDDSRDDRDSDDSGDDRDPDDDRAPKATGVSLKEAAAAALKAQPGKLTSIELDDDGGRAAWEAEVVGKDGKEYELNIDATSAKVTPERDDSDD